MPLKIHQKPRHSMARNAPDNSYIIETSFQDSISDLQFSPNERYLAATSWDGIIQVWKFNEQYLSPESIFQYSQTSMMTQTKQGYLRCCFEDPGSHLFWSTTQGEVFNVDLDSPTSQSPSRSFTSNFPVIGLKWCKDESCLIILTNNGNANPTTRGTLIIYRSPENSIEIQLDSKPINLTVHGKTILVATLGPNILKFDIQQAMAANNKGIKVPSFLKEQILSIAISPANPNICLTTTILGELEINDYKSGQPKSRIIPCHRNEKDASIYCVNCVAAHPTQAAAITAGGDGYITFFNIEKERPGRVFQLCNLQLTAVSISNNGEVAAIAQGYDWSRGAKTFQEHRDELKKVVLYIKKISKDMF